MPLNNQQRENLAQLSANAGRMLLTNRQRIALSAGTSFLLIGLGGTGIDALMEAKGLINCTCQLPEGRELPSNVAVLAFETDPDVEHTAKSSKQTGEINLAPGEFVNLHVNQLAAYLAPAYRAQRANYISDWLDTRLENIRNVNHGAGGIRQLGRLMMYLNIDRIIQVLSNAIQTLTAGNANNLTVFILNGLGGGTGSGTFLDMGYIVREVVSRQVAAAYALNNTTIYNYSIMPDVNASVAGVPDAARAYIPKNGFAALKELDYLMRTVERGRSFIQQYNATFQVNSRNTPFDNVHLISKLNAAGLADVNPYQHACYVISESIMALMTVNQGADGNNANAASVYVNIVGMAPAIRNNYPYQEAYAEYLSIGAASFAVPLDKIILYVTSLLFEGMDAMYARSPEINETVNEVEAFIGQIGLKMDGADGLIRAVQPDIRTHNHDTYTYKQLIKPGTVDLQAVSEQLISGHQRGMSARRLEAEQAVKARFDAEINRLFQDLQKGPVYASRLINSSQAADCLLKYLTECHAWLTDERNKVERTLADCQGQIQVAGREAEAVILGIGANEKKNAYVDAYNKYITQMARRDAIITVQGMLQPLYDYFNDRNNRIFDTVKEALLKLQEIFRDNAAILTEVNVQQDNRGQNLTWQMIQIPEIQDELREAFLSLTDTPELVRRLINQIYNNLHVWTDENAPAFTRQMLDFIDNNFGSIIDKSLEEYLIVKIWQENKKMNPALKKDQVNLQAEIARPNGLIASLLTRAASMMHPQPMTPIGTVNDVNTVFVPHNCTLLYHAINNYTQNNPNHRFALYRSSLKTRLHMISFRLALPLYAFEGIQQIEQAYVGACNAAPDVQAGMHLYQNKNRNWQDLPSPVIERSWPETYEVDRTRSKNRENRALFTELLNRGLAQAEQGQVSFILTGDRFAEGRDLAALTSPECLQTRQVWDRTKISQIIQTLQAGYPEIRRHPVAGDSVIIGEKFILDYDLVEWMKTEKAKRDALDTEILRLQQLLQQLNLETQICQDTFQALQTGIIIQVENTMLYRTTVEGNEITIVEFRNMRTKEMELVQTLVEWRKDPRRNLLYEKIMNLVRQKIDGYRLNRNLAYEQARAIYEPLKRKFDRIETDYQLNESTVDTRIYEFYHRLLSIARNELVAYED